LQWNWNNQKAAENIRKHGVSFDIAALALDDTSMLIDADPHPDGDRWDVLCQINGITLFVVTAWSELADNQMGRIISARKATSGERKKYDENWQLQTSHARAATTVADD